MTLQRIETKIIPRVSSEGHPFSELLHEYEVDGITYHALSRVNYSLSDTLHSRAAQNEAFRVRFNRALG